MRKELAASREHLRLQRDFGANASLSRRWRGVWSEIGPGAVVERHFGVVAVEQQVQRPAS
ncbi:MAG: hypothetical protein WKG07_16970 [Hymenobacter sp.]